MQPENQPGNPVPPAPQAPQPTPQPVYQAAPQQSPSMQEQIAQTLQSQQVPQQVAQPYQSPQPTPPPQSQAAPRPVAAPAVAVPPQPQPAPLSPEALGSVAVADQVEGGYGYDAGEQEEYDDEGEIDLSEPVTWQAKEFIHQEKGASWFIAFAVTIAIFMAIAILLMRSWSFAILLVVIAVVIVILSKRPPRVMEYALSEDGLHIDNTLHKYDDFKSFGVVRDSGEFSVMLIPRRRFMPGITVYFPEEAGEDIVDVLGSRLPMRDLHLDVVDKLVRKLRL